MDSSHNSDQLDFGTTPDDQDLSTIPNSNDEEKEIHRYDDIPDDQTKRKQVLYDIKIGKDNGGLDADEFPVIFKKWAELFNVSKDAEGRFKFTIPQGSYGAIQYKKLAKFLHTGYVGDALASSSMPEIQKMARNIAREIVMHIPTKNTHLTRKIEALRKNGKFADIVGSALRKTHYDLFDHDWYNTVLNPMVLEAIHELRKSVKVEESFVEQTRTEIRKIFG
jgi:hypothetical protein